MLDLVNLGADVTKFRTRLQKNYGYLTDDACFEELMEINKADKPSSRSDIFEHFIELTQSFVTTTFMLKSLEEIYKRPFLINRYALLFLELYFGQESEHPLNENRLKYLMHLCEQRIHDINHDKGIEPLTKLLHYHRIEHPQDIEYAFYFALTLRQTDVLQTPDFLKHSSKRYEGDYLAFLDLILVDFDDVFMEKTKVVIRDWIHAQQEEITLLKKTAFLPVPKGWKRIEGRMEPAEIKNAFSFLYEIGEFLHDKRGYLEKDEVKEFLKFGIAYPVNGDAQHRLTLNVDQEKSGRLFFYCIFQIMKRHERIARDTNYKTAWAYFLKYRFSNFADMSVQAIKNEIRNRRPKSVPLDFDFQKISHVQKKNVAG